MITEDGTNEIEGTIIGKSFTRNSFPRVITDIIVNETVISSIVVDNYVVISCG